MESNNKTFRLTQEQYSKFQLLCEEAGITMSDLIRIALKRVVKKGIKKNEIPSSYRNKTIGIKLSSSDLELMNQAKESLGINSTSECCRISLKLLSDDLEFINSEESE